MILGVVLLAIAAVVSYYSSYLLAVLAVMDGKAITKYRDIGREIFGQARGVWLTLPFQWLVLIG
eukprot:scaffold396657_cov32-Prasinocladus_malaysianus.AAC.1